MKYITEVYHTSFCAHAPTWLNRSTHILRQNRHPNNLLKLLFHLFYSRQFYFESARCPSCTDTYDYPRKKKMLQICWENWRLNCEKYKKKIRSKMLYERIHSNEVIWVMDTNIKKNEWFAKIFSYLALHLWFAWA